MLDNGLAICKHVFPLKAESAFYVVLLCDLSQIFFSNEIGMQNFKYASILKFTSI